MTTNMMETKPIATGIDICVRSDSLVLEHVSRLLGVKPTSGFEKGEPYIGRQKRGSEIVAVERVRPFGVWHFCTSESSDSNNVEEHAALLLETLAPAKTAIGQLIADPQYYVKITIWVVGYTFDVSSRRLAGLLPFAEDFTITCWEKEDDETE